MVTWCIDPHALKKKSQWGNYFHCLSKLKYHFIILTNMYYAYTFNMKTPLLYKLLSELMKDYWIFPSYEHTTYEYHPWKNFNSHCFCRSSGPPHKQLFSDCCILYSAFSFWISFLVFKIVSISTAFNNFSMFCLHNHSDRIFLFPHPIVLVELLILCGRCNTFTSLFGCNAQCSFLCVSVFYYVTFWTFLDNDDDLHNDFNQAPSWKWTQEWDEMQTKESK